MYLDFLRRVGLASQENPYAYALLQQEQLRQGLRLPYVPDPHYVPLEGKEVPPVVYPVEKQPDPFLELTNCQFHRLLAEFGVMVRRLT